MSSNLAPLLPWGNKVMQIDMRFPLLGTVRTVSSSVLQLLDEFCFSAVVT